MPLTTLKVSNFIDDSVTVGKLSATGTASASTYLRGDNTWSALSGMSGLYNASTATSYAVTVSGSKFYIDGALQATISLTEGYTAIFDVSDASVATHILRFSATSDGTHGGGTQYVGGVKALGTPGSAGAKVFFTVPENAPTLYYYCTAHSAMGGTANTTAAATKSVGDMWIDRGTLKLVRSGSIIENGAWVSQSGLNTARYGISGGGSLSAAISFCGYASPGVSGATETWDGSTWTDVADATASDVAAGGGTQTAAIVFGGWHYPNSLNRTQTFDGSSWAAGGNLITGTGYLAGCGTQTAALKFSGNIPSFTSNTTEEYNGTSWSASNNLNTERANMGGDGIVSSAIGGGGSSSSGQGTDNRTETYDGTSWSNSGNLSANRCAMGVSAGNASAAISGGGYTGSYSWVNITDVFDGTSWSVSGTLVTTRGMLGACGTPQQALNFGGHTGPGGVNNCESWEVPITDFVGQT